MILPAAYVLNVLDEADRMYEMIIHVTSKRYVSPRPMTSDSLAIGGLATAKMMPEAVPNAPIAETLLNEEVA
jgi:hypothetical protein